MAKQSWKRLAWLGLMVPAVGISWGGILMARPCCEKVEWYSVLLPPGPELAMVLVIAVGLAIVGIAGALGLLPTALVGGAKVRWALWSAGLPWSLFLAGCSLFTINQSRPGTNPIFRTNLGDLPGVVLISAAGFALSATMVWLVLFLADAIRHTLGTLVRRAGPDVGVHSSNN